MKGRSDSRSPIMHGYKGCVPFRLPIVLKIGGIFYVMLSLYFMVSYIYIRNNPHLDDPYSVQVSPISPSVFVSDRNYTVNQNSKQHVHIQKTKRYRKWSNAAYIQRTFQLPLVLVRKMTHGRTFASALLGFSFFMSPYYFPLSFIFEDGTLDNHNVNSRLDAA